MKCPKCNGNYFKNLKDYITIEPINYFNDEVPSFLKKINKIVKVNQKWFAFFNFYKRKE